MNFSIVYPIQDKPQFLQKAFYFLSKQKYKNFEVVVSDNFTDPSFSCKTECENAARKYNLDIKHITPEKPLSMVDNWNFAFDYTSGDYILYMSFKKFLLPDALSVIVKDLSDSLPEIINWPEDWYLPDNFDYYFASGRRLRITQDRLTTDKPTAFDPLQELSLKMRGQATSRCARGQIYSGAYSRSLCDKIISKAGLLFHPLAPDITSMVLALGLAQSAVELPSAHTIHVYTDISNGANVAKNDQRMRRYFDENLNKNEIKLFASQVYASISNLVVSDYINTAASNGIEVNLDWNYWTSRVWEDLLDEERSWSDKKIQNEQFALFYDHLKNTRAITRTQIRLNVFASIFKRRLRAAIIGIIKSVAPDTIQSKLRNRIGRETIRCSRIEDVLTSTE